MKYGYIYKISYNGLDYYGSSKNKYRFIQHKSLFNAWKGGRTNYTTSFKLFEEAEKNVEEPTFEIILCYDKYVCNECIKREEQKWIDDNECVNTHNAFGLDKEQKKKQQKVWRGNNKDYNKKWCEANKLK